MNLAAPIKEYFDKKTSFEKNAFLAQLPTLKDVKEIGKGLANDNFLLDFGNGTKYVMRFNIWPDRVWYNGNPISVENEFQTLKFLELSGVAPKAYFVDASKTFFPFEFLVEEYIEHDGKIVSDDFVGVAVSVKKLHSLHITGSENSLRKDATADEKIELYDSWLEEVLANNKTKIANLFSQHAETYKDYLNKNSDLLTGNSLIHRDLFPENFLHQGDAWFLVDWQTAVIGNPIQDVAYLLWDFIYLYTLKRPLTEAEKKTIITSYFGEQADVAMILTQVRRLLPIFYIDLFLWLLYKAESIKKQQFDPELKEFLWNRIAVANDLILKEDQVEYWFSEMRK